MKKKRGIWWKIAAAIGTLTVAVVIFFAALLEPNVKIAGWERLDEQKLVKSRQAVCFLDDEGNAIDSVVYDSNKRSETIDNIPEHTVDAFVSIEDKRFFKHKGVDYKRIIGAFFSNIKSFSFKEGASTISQQLIKNTHLTSEKKISRKIKEIRIAKELERRFSKSEIMEMYLNILYFGDNIYGITAAAKVMFDREPKDLTVSQSALLAGIINNPSKYSPYRNPENAIKRRDLVLKKMYENKKISEDTYFAALEEPLGVSEKNERHSGYLNGTINELIRITGSKNKAMSQNYTVATYCDKDMETRVGQILSEAAVPQNSDARIAVLKNKNSEIVCDVSLSDKDLSSLRRQPGSTIKPLLCYAPALDGGNIYCCSPIDDSPAVFGEYSPSNYSDKYYGWVSAEYALIRSLNIPAVKLLETCGVDYCKSVCEKFGIKFAENDDSLALALGGMTDGVTLYELLAAYRAFASGGRYSRCSAVKYIADEDGKVIYSDKKKETTAVSETTAYLMNTMLRKCAAEGTAKKLSSFDNVCAKTGTVGDKDGNTDIYCVAYSPRYTVAVWVGNLSEKMPNSVTSSGLASELAAKVFALLPDGRQFEKPEGVVCRYIDSSVWKNEHKVMLAGSDIALKDKSAEWFSCKYVPGEYSTPQGIGYYDYDDMLNLDFDNFKIVEGFFD